VVCGTKGIHTCYRINTRVCQVCESRGGWDENVKCEKIAHKAHTI